MVNLDPRATKYAPILIYPADEPSLPCNVDWFLTRTSLWFQDYDGATRFREKIVDHPSQEELRSATHLSNATTIRANGTRSNRKRVTFYLTDVPDDAKGGSRNPADWITYVHMYPNDIQGLTIQYWRLHAYNLGVTTKLKIGPLETEIKVGFHGGDWEGVHVVLNAMDEPTHMRFLRHSDILELQWSDVEKEGTHPIIYSERGGHASQPNGNPGGIRHETWGGSGGIVLFPGDAQGHASGELLDVGSKIAPSNGQYFIQYSGLWGSPSAFPLPGSDPYYVSSGYWGPAYNETSMGTDGYITAWGSGAANPEAADADTREFYPRATSA